MQEEMTVIFMNLRSTVLQSLFQNTCNVVAKVPPYIRLSDEIFILAKVHK